LHQPRSSSTRIKIGVDGGGQISGGKAGLEANPTHECRFNQPIISRSLMALEGKLKAFTDNYAASAGYWPIRCVPDPTTHRVNQL
jgi:hypothetical protein